tara:strand:+ start:163 stop:510 length:348 start_codon:yes stop_codon:yes gene_type:complete
VELVLAVGLCVFSIASVVSILVPAVRVSRSIKEGYDAIDAVELLRVQLPDLEAHAVEGLYYDPGLKTFRSSASQDSLMVSLVPLSKEEASFFKRYQIEVKKADKLLHVSYLSYLD